MKARVATLVLTGFFLANFVQAQIFQGGDWQRIFQYEGPNLWWNQEIVAQGTSITISSLFCEHIPYDAGNIYFVHDKAVLGRGLAGGWQVIYTTSTFPLNFQKIDITDNGELAIIGNESISQPPSVHSIWIFSPGGNLLDKKDIPGEFLYLRTFAYPLVGGDTATTADCQGLIVDVKTKEAHIFRAINPGTEAYQYEGFVHRISQDGRFALLVDRITSPVARIGLDPVWRVVSQNVSLYCLDSFSSPALIWQKENCFDAIDFLSSEFCAGSAYIGLDPLSLEDEDFVGAVWETFSGDLVSTTPQMVQFVSLDYVVAQQEVYKKRSPVIAAARHWNRYQ